jgi:hypothetical protein
VTSDVKIQLRFLYDTLPEMMELIVRDLMAQHKGKVIFRRNASKQTDRNYK